MTGKKARVITTTSIKIWQQFHEYYCSPPFEDDETFKNIVSKAQWTKDNSPNYKRSIEEQLIKYVRSNEFLILFNNYWNKLYKYVRLYDVKANVEKGKGDIPMNMTIDCKIDFTVDSEVINILEFLANNSIAFTTENNTQIRFVQLKDHIKCYLIE